MKINRFGQILKLTHTAKFYRNGDGAGFVMNWWNPISWLLTPILIVLSIVVIGAKETFAHTEDLGLRMDPYLKKNPHLIEWL